MGDAQQHNDTVAHSAVAKASWRILPLIGLAYLVAWMDRMNISRHKTLIRSPVPVCTDVKCFHLCVS